MEWFNLVVALALVGGSWFATVRLLDRSMAPRSRVAAHREHVAVRRHARQLQLFGPRAGHRAR